VVVFTCNSNTRKGGFGSSLLEAGGLKVPGQPHLHREALSKKLTNKHYEKRISCFLNRKKLNHVFFFPHLRKCQLPQFFLTRLAPCEVILKDNLGSKPDYQYLNLFSWNSTEIIILSLTWCVHGTSNFTIG
jgi:hypothetical protein